MLSKLVRAWHNRTFLTAKKRKLPTKPPLTQKEKRTILQTHYQTSQFRGKKRKKGREKDKSDMKIPNAYDICIEKNAFKIPYPNRHGHTLLPMPTHTSSFTAHFQLFSSIMGRLSSSGRRSNWGRARGRGRGILGLDLWRFNN